MKQVNTFKKVLPFVVGGLLLTSCGKEETTSDKFNNAAETYVNIVVANYDDSYNEAKELNTLINDFIANPTAAGLEACKKQWLEARVPYGQTEAFRFYNGPIDREGVAGYKDGVEGLLNAWPMDEAFVDYVEGDANSGLINNPTKYPNITAEVLASINEEITPESIFTGYHAIEFLLWGQDLYTDSAGKRPYTDFTTAPNADRRKQYLNVVSELLLENIDTVRKEWAEGAKYRTAFLVEDKNTTVENVIGAIAELAKGELSGERMFVAVDSQDQENEHSCFADNTHIDILENFNGVANVYNGTYTYNGKTTSGTSYASIVKEFNADADKAVQDAINNARTKINAIPTPFDQAIINNRETVLEAVTALEDLSDRIAEAKTVLKNAK